MTLSLPRIGMEIIIPAVHRLRSGSGTRSAPTTATHRMVPPISLSLVIISIMTTLSAMTPATRSGIGMLPVGMSSGRMVPITIDKQIYTNKKKN